MSSNHRLPIAKTITTLDWRNQKSIQLPWHSHSCRRIKMAVGDETFYHEDPREARTWKKKKGVRKKGESRGGRTYKWTAFVPWLRLYSRHALLFITYRFQQHGCSSTLCRRFFNGLVLTASRDTTTEVFTFCRERNEEGTLIHLRSTCAAASLT